MKRSLAQVRDLLLPGVRQVAKETGTALDLACDYTTDSVILLRPGAQHVLFTRKDIDDNLTDQLRDRIGAILK